MAKKFKIKMLKKYEMSDLALLHHFLENEEISTSWKSFVFVRRNMLKKCIKFSKRMVANK